MVITSGSGHVWVNLLGGAFLICNSFVGIAKGKAIFVARKVTKCEDRSLFWLTVWASALLGIAMVATAL